MHQESNLNNNNNNSNQKYPKDEYFQSKENWEKETVTLM